MIKGRIKPRQGPLRPQTGAGRHSTNKNYQRQIKHRNRNTENG